MWLFKKDPEKDPEDIRFWLNGTPETFHRYEKSKGPYPWNIEYNLNEEIVKKLEYIEIEWAKVQVSFNNI